MKLPPLSRLPKRGPVSWRTRYCSPGDRVTVWTDLQDANGDWARTSRQVLITRVKRNKYGRVSYETDQDELIVAEDLVKDSARVVR